MMSVSTVSYQEMALLNIGYCYMQLNEQEKAKIAYQKALDEFPNSWLAKEALEYFEALEKEDKPTETTTDLLKDEDDVELV